MDEVLLCGPCRRKVAFAAAEDAHRELRKNVALYGGAALIVAAAALATAFFMIPKELDYSPIGPHGGEVLP